MQLSLSSLNYKQKSVLTEVFYLFIICVMVPLTIGLQIFDKFSHTLSLILINLLNIPCILLFYRWLLPVTLGRKRYRLFLILFPVYVVVYELSGRIASLTVSILSFIPKEYRANLASAHPQDFTVTFIIQNLGWTCLVLLAATSLYVIRQLFKNQHTLFQLETDKLKLDDNLLYQLIFLLQKYEMIIMKYVILTALGKITNPDFPPEALLIPEYKTIIRDLSSDFDECNKVFAQVNDLVNDKKKIWERSPKNAEFLKIANSEMECNETFCFVYKETINEFFKNLSFQFKCQTEGTDGEMVDADYLKMIRYLQICCCVEAPYNYFVKTEMEDSSQMFYHFYDVMTTMEKKALIGDIKKNWGF